MNHLHPNTDLIVLYSFTSQTLAGPFKQVRILSTLVFGPERERRSVSLEKQDKFFGPEFPSLLSSLPPVSAVHHCQLPLSPSSSLWWSRAYVSVVPWWLSHHCQGRRECESRPGSSESDSKWLDQGLPQDKKKVLSMQKPQLPPSRDTARRENQSFSLFHFCELIQESLLPKKVPPLLSLRRLCLGKAKTASVPSGCSQPLGGGWRIIDHSQSQKG